ncbi:MAG: hypothetical protein LLF96_07465 [Eubacteriales bacterium]|nr:hypothetical protein [Eubacteriales bacterium]
MEGLKYRCSAGEAFDSVALKLYGDEKYAADLLGANPALCRTVRFAGGEELNVPVIEVPENDSETPATAPWKEA